MDQYDAEIMEVAGDYFLELALIPQAWFESQAKPVTVGRDDFYCPPITWWRHHTLGHSIHEFCDPRFTRTDSVGYYLIDGIHETAWTDENNHRVEIIQNEADETLDLTVLIDVRTAYSDFLDVAVAMAVEVQCLFYEFQGEIFFEPNRGPVIEAISRHDMTHVAIDSSGRLTRH